jgi:hypothetical protein
MALSLRRANAVKDALVRDGVPAQAITVVGIGEKGLRVQTGDGVREPQEPPGRDRRPVASAGRTEKAASRATSGAYVGVCCLACTGSIW